jgi:membrane-associated phospholipid phosphatase
VTSQPEPIVMPPPVELYVRRRSFYRRIALLASLALGLMLFLSALPAEARGTLSTALRAQLPLVLLFLAFALIALSLVWTTGQRLDTHMFMLFNLHGFRPRWLDRIMWLATQLGNMLAAVALALTFVLLSYRGMAVEVVLGTITLWLLVELVKVLTDRERPYLALEGVRVIGWRERGRSFPSGHTSQTFFLITLVIHRFPPGLGITAALYLLALFIGFTRLYVGAHYPRDVLGGAVLGSIWAGVVALLEPYLFGLGF